MANLEQDTYQPSFLEIDQHLGVPVQEYLGGTALWLMTLETGE